MYLSIYIHTYIHPCMRKLRHRYAHTHMNSYKLQSWLQAQSNTRFTADCQGAASASWAAEKRPRRAAAAASRLTRCFWAAVGGINTHRHIYMYVHIFIYIYIHIHIEGYVTTTMVVSSFKSQHNRDDSGIITGLSWI